MGRFSLFNSDGGPATLYAYENDGRFRFTIRSFTGTGTHNFILLRKRIGTRLLVEAKYASTRFGRTTIKGAGADLYAGTLIREFNTQIILNI